MNQQTCNRAWLDAFLQSELNQREEQMLTSHLDECSDCREALESLAAEQSVWREASELLGGSNLNSTVAIGDSRSGTVHSPQIALVLQQLAPTDDPDSLGRIGGYEVTGVVGAGGMGVVLKAHDRSLDRIVAIKVMAPHLASNGSARKRFAREAKAAAAVLHPNVIAIHSVASEDANPYLVMPFVRGASLQKRIDSQGPLPLKDTLRIGAQIAAGLAAAHEQGLVHRDIKPANILLEEGVERVTITDFGLARAVDDASMTCSGVIAGTPQYMSPEQARGEPIDARSDLFSLGGVLYAMCTGRSPFRAETTYGVLHRIANDSPTPACEVNSDIPAWLGHVIERLMAKRPEDRFESAAQAAELLEGCLAHVQQPTAISLPDAVAAIAPQLICRPPIAKLIAAAAGALAIFLAGVVIVLEFGKGTLTIESELDDVPIRILQGDAVVKTFTVSREGATTRIGAGKYVVEIGQGFDKAVVNDGGVELSRGATSIVKIMQANAHTSAVEHAKNEAAQIASARWEEGPSSVAEEAVAGHSEIVPATIDTERASNAVKRVLQYLSAMQKNDSETIKSIAKGLVKHLKREKDIATLLTSSGIPKLYKSWFLNHSAVVALGPLSSTDKQMNGRFLLFTLSLVDERWSIVDIDLEVEEKLLERFKNPPQAVDATNERTSTTPKDNELNTSSNSSAEFPPVKIVVHDEEGKPREGVKVSLYQLAKGQGGQVLEINETSNASGLAVNRSLPYGHYELSATTADGWYLTGHRSQLNVEFEKGVDAILVAPTPGKTSKLVISSGITTSPEKISGLRFGQLRQGNLTDYAPEPEGSETSKEREFASFPTINNGIEYIGAEIRLVMMRTISQPAPSLQHMNTHWNWTPASNSKVNLRYLIANGQARSFEQAYTSEDKSLERLPVTGSEFFKLPSPKHRVGASLLKLREPTELPLELDIPAGTVKVTIGSFLGKPSEAVMAALNWQPQERQPELWLAATIDSESAWVERLINTEWLNSPFRGGGVATFPLLWREQTLQPGERLEIPLGMKQKWLQQVGDSPETALASPNDNTLPDPNATESKAPTIDLRNARSVVEAYVAAALAGEVAKAAALAKNSPADVKRIKELPEFLNVQRLKIQTVYINDPDKPTQALATSVAVKLDEEHKNPDGRRDGLLTFRLELTGETWFVIDIDFETESGAEKELNRFLKDHPNSIGIPPQ